MGKKHRDKEFELTLLDSIDEAFSTLGENTKKLIYSHLMKQFAIPRQEIPFRVDEFSMALEKVFGLGAQHLEILIMKNLQAKIKASTEEENTCWTIPTLTFSRYIELMKTASEDSEKIGDLRPFINNKTNAIRQNTKNKVKM